MKWVKVFYLIICIGLTLILSEVLGSVMAIGIGIHVEDLRVIDKISIIILSAFIARHLAM